jgi:hypothetical protein
MNEAAAARGNVAVPGAGMALGWPMSPKTNSLRWFSRGISPIWGSRPTPLAGFSGIAGGVWENHVTYK